MSSVINPAIIVAFIYAIALPLVLLIWLKKLTKEKLWCFIVGAVCFFVFAYVLESIMHQYVLLGNNSVSAAINSSPVLYMLYAAFAAGIFEETGRLFGFKVLLRKHKEKECAIAYGIGHGGIEVILILGVTYLVYLLASLGIQLGDENTTAQIVAAANSIPMSSALTAMLERLSAMMIHIGLSMIMFVASKIKGKLWLYPVAVCLHALADAPAALMQFGILKSLFGLEAFEFVLAIVILIIGARIIIRNTKVEKDYSESEQSEPETVHPEEIM